MASRPANRLPQGHAAGWLTDSDLDDDPYGEQSPLARLVETDATILLLGAPLDALTLVHHAERIAAAEPKALGVLRDANPPQRQLKASVPSVSRRAERSPAPVQVARPTPPAPSATAPQAGDDLVERWARRGRCVCGSRPEGRIRSRRLLDRFFSDELQAMIDLYRSDATNRKPNQA
jgi:Aminoglycoside 3-N-acetyltransferase